MDTKTQFAAFLGALVLGLLSLAAMVAMQGLIFSYLWLWYLVPLGLPAIGILHAFMLMLMFRLTLYRMDTKKTDKGEGWEKTGQIVILWLFGWGVGYLLSFAV